jgi:hypothetical protein
MKTKPTAAFVLTLLAGLWMLGAGAMMYGYGPGLALWGPMGPASAAGRAGAGDPGDAGDTMMGFGMMHGLMRPLGPMGSLPWLGPVGGAFLLVGSVALYSRPSRAWGWGLAILLVSGLNLLVGMGGLLAGALGLIGGALAMSWETPPAA